MFMLLSALLWWKKAWKCLPPCPWTRRTLFVVDQSIAVCFLSLLFFSLMTKILRLRLFQSVAENCQGDMLFVSLCHQARWWRPGRVETLACSEVRASLNSSLLVLCLGCSGFADCLLTLPQLLTFPVDHERDGVELALLREADSFDVFISIVTKKRRRRFNWQGVTQ